MCRPCRKAIGIAREDKETHVYVCAVLLHVWLRAIASVCASLSVLDVAVFALICSSIGIPSARGRVRSDGPSAESVCPE